jgi:hypothetical protein
MEPTPLQVCVFFSPSNYLLRIVTKLGQKVVQNPHIHGYVILMP